MTALGFLKSLQASCAMFVRDLGNGLLEVSHNGLAMVGLAVVAMAAFMVGNADLRHTLEVSTLGWLKERHEARAERDGNVLVTLAEPDAVARATAVDPKALTRQQAAVAGWIARRYKVAPEPVSRLVQEAWQVGNKVQLEPTLILAIMAVESRFNPFAQSHVGAQGLMQVMTQLHDDKYVAFGGQHAAFDPVTNLRVGVQVLKDCIARAGSLEGGLRFYVGAANLPDDGGYAAKVLGEQGHLKLVAAGRSVPITVPQAPPGATRATAPVPAETIGPVKAGEVPTPAADAGASAEHLALR